LKLIRYIQYFFYIGINWGWTIALVILRQEIKGEKKYGINTTGADELKTLRNTGIDTAHATIYMPVSYTLIEKTLAQIAPQDKKHFLDIGCGKGRALCVAAHFGFNKITGIDFSEKLCRAAIENTDITKQQIPAANFSIITLDAVNMQVPADADCIFLFNPFDEIVMKKVLNNILDSLKISPRQLNIIYANPLYKNLFTENNFKEVYYSKAQQYFEVSILNRRH
jgi:SAM-dependent methyltransferase